MSTTEGAQLDREAIGRVDSTDQATDILAIPEHLRDALWKVESAGLDPWDSPGGLVVAGMGGSAIGGELARAILGDQASRPVLGARAYGLPPWTTQDTTVLCASYSGDTEETLACFEAAGAAGAGRVVLTTGGKLAQAARDEDVPVIGVPAGMQPRAAVLYMMVGTLECAALCGAAPALHSEIDASTGLLEQLVDEWGPEAADDSQAKALAAQLAQTVPVIHGAGPTVALARRWHTQLNENANAAAFWTELPEANHNEICGWERGRGLAPLAAVFLCDADQHPRIQRRIGLTGDVAEHAGAPSSVVKSRGDSRLERVLSMLLLGDLMSVYLAVLEGVDPTPVEPLVRFKAALAAQQ